MKFFKLLLSEDTGLSCLRFMSLVSLLLGSLIAVLSLILKSNLDGITPLVAVFVGSAFGGKIGQKYFEGKK